MNDLKALRASKGYVKCKHCGINNAKTLKYCKHCGHKLVIPLEQKETLPLNQGLSKGTIPGAIKKYRGYMETKLGLQEVDTQILPVEGMNLSMMSLLAEEANRKKKKARLIKGVMIASCLTGAVGGYCWYDQQDLRAAKTAYANEQLDVLLTLKQEMSESDWRAFETYQMSKLDVQLRNARQGKADPQAMMVQMNQLLTVMEDESLKKTLEGQIQTVQLLITDDQAYQAGMKAQAEGLRLEAYKAFLKVSKDHPKTKDVQAYLNQLQAEALTEWSVYLQQLLKEQRYSELIEEATLYLSIQSKDANVVAMKKQAEQAVQSSAEKEPVKETVKPVEESVKNPDQKEPASKPETELKEPVKEKEEPTPPSDVVADEEPSEPNYLTLKNEQVVKVDQVKLHFKLNRLSPTLWPDKVTKASNSFESEAGTVYFDFLFGVTNGSKEALNLIDLIQGASVTDGDGKTYDQFVGFYNETSEKLSPIYPWSVLAPGKTTTMHVVIQVPKTLKTKVTPLTARIQIKDQWYQKDIPAQ